MRTIANALDEFCNSFSIPAYSENTVPDTVDVPYLIYPIVEPEWNQKTPWHIQGWYRSKSNADLYAKADEIVHAIGTGITIRTGSGFLVIYPDTPLIQTMVNGDFRSFYISLSINNYQMPGAYIAPEEGDN